MSLQHLKCFSGRNGDGGCIDSTQKCQEGQICPSNLDFCPRGYLTISFFFT